jgi:hypothetical protein
MVQALLCVNALVLYGIYLLLFITKWFPYTSSIVRLREWLYRFF